MASHSVSVPLFVFLGLLIEMTGMARAMVGFLARFSAMFGAASPMSWSGPCIWSREFPVPKRLTWPRLPGAFPEMKERGAKPGDLSRFSRPRAPRSRPFRPRSC